MTNDWKETTLGDVLELKRGYDLSQKDRIKGQFPLISSAGFSDSHNEAKVKAPGVVTGRYGTIGNVFYSEKDFWPLNTTLYVRNFKGNDAKFIYYFLKTIDYQQYSDKAAVPGVNRNHLHLAKVSIPENIKEQKAIAHILGSLDDKIELNRQMNVTLEAMAQALFKSWFVDFDPVIDNALAAGNPIPDELEAKAAARQALGDARKPLPEDIRSLFPNAFVFTEEMGWIPEGWEVGTLSDIVKDVRDNVKTEDIQDSDLYVGLEHIGRKQLFLENTDFGDKVVSNKSKFKKMDILFGKLRPYFHKVCIAPHAGICSTDILVFRPKNKHMQSLTTMALFNDKLVEYANLRSTGTRMPRANASDILAYPFVRVSEQLAKHFDLALAPFWEKGITATAEKQSLEQLRDTLLPKLLSGELRIPEAERLVEESVA